MKKIKIRMPDDELREKLVVALVEAGFPVWIEYCQIEEENTTTQNEEYVCTQTRSNWLILDESE